MDYDIILGVKYLILFKINFKCMLRLSKVLRYGIINPKIVHNAREFKKDPKIDYVYD